MQGSDSEFINGISLDTIGHVVASPHSNLSPRQMVDYAQHEMDFLRLKH